jgi:hypothetical protein
MPTIDVTDVLLDPDVAGQSFTVIRRVEIVNNFGESTLVTKTVPDVIGSIQPNGDNSLMREGSYDAQAKSIIVVTPFRLRGVAKGPGGITYKPDIIISDIFGAANMFEVSSIKGWGSFGYGFVEAEATTIPWIDFPTAPQLPILYIGRLDFSQPKNSGLTHGAGGTF